MKLPKQTIKPCSMITRIVPEKKVNKVSPYFGLTRTMYLQTLANRWGDFGVSWNFVQENGELGFTKKRSVIELWSEDYLNGVNPKESRLEKVMHREKMPREHFIEIDDSPFVSKVKLHKTKRICEEKGMSYAIYKSRKGYHISVMDMKGKCDKKGLILEIKSDLGMKSPRSTWSMEWTQHWKQKDFVIECVEYSPSYPRDLLGSIYIK